MEEIQKNQPDILFLDIEMPRLNGFDLLTKIPQINFEIISITAYDEYAVRAFRINALDYLLKPVISSDLIEAIKRVQNKRQNHSERPDEISLQLEKLKRSFNKIPLASNEGIDFVFPEQILYCKSEGSYTYVITDKKKILITKSLRDMESVLEPHDFLRTHKSFLVNLSHIIKYIKVDGGYLIMSNGDKAAVSRRKKDDLMKLF